MVLMVSGQITFNLIYLFSLSLKIEECDLTGILKKSTLLGQISSGNVLVIFHQKSKEKKVHRYSK